MAAIIKTPRVNVAHPLIFEFVSRSTGVGSGTVLSGVGSGALVVVGTSVGGTFVGEFVGVFVGSFDVGAFVVGAIVVGAIVVGALVGGGLGRFGVGLGVGLGVGVGIIGTTETLEGSSAVVSSKCESQSTDVGGSEQGASTSQAKHSSGGSTSNLFLSRMKVPAINFGCQQQSNSWGTLPRTKKIVC